MSQSEYYSGSPLWSSLDGKQFQAATQHWITYINKQGPRSEPGDCAEGPPGEVLLQGGPDRGAGEHDPGTHRLRGRILYQGHGISGITQFYCWQSSKDMRRISDIFPWILSPKSQIPLDAPRELDAGALVLLLRGASVEQEVVLQRLLPPLRKAAVHGRQRAARWCQLIH